jgi:hypothetical protein
MERRPDIECVLAYEEKAGGGFALCQIDAPNKGTKSLKRRPQERPGSLL